MSLLDGVCDSGVEGCRIAGYTDESHERLSEQKKSQESIHGMKKMAMRLSIGGKVVNEVATGFVRVIEVP